LSAVAAAPTPRRVRPLPRYLFGVAAVLAAFGLRMLLIPLTGVGAPFVLFFAATLVTSLFAGPGPGVLTILLGMPCGAYLFGVRAGYSLSQASFQGLLYSVDGLIVVYLSMVVRRAQRGLSDANERFRQTIDEAPIGMALVTLEGRFVRVNRTLCEIVGYSAGELSVLHFADITHPEDVTADVELAARLARGEIQRCQFTKRYLRRDGSVVDVMLSTSVLRDRDNVPQYFITQIEDITERKRAERELRLSEAKLRRALAARDQVLGIVAHDLRSPLSTILVTSTALPQEDERTKKAREVLTRAATRMSRLIQDLLDVALVEAGQLRVIGEAVPARELVHEALETARPLFVSSQVEVGSSLDPELPAVLGDRDRLLQVFENLVGNAIKFTAAGGQVTVGAAAREREVLFWVADTGCGIAPDNLGHVFDRFWQATASTRRLGAGLGLPITKGIVEAHGGRIWVESALGGGSTFYFVIPRAAPPEDFRAAQLH
jgi:PAS domain S-box-containing protein